MHPKAPSGKPSAYTKPLPLNLQNHSLRRGIFLIQIFFVYLPEYSPYSVFALENMATNAAQLNGTPYFRPAGNAQGLANYPHARLIPAGNGGTHIYVSGTSSRRGDGSFVGCEKVPNSNGKESLKLDIKLQTEAVLANMKAIIEGATNGRASMQNVVDATVFITNMERDYSGMNEEWNKVWPDRQAAPARTTVEVRALPRPEILVEIKCVAYLE